MTLVSKITPPRFARVLLHGFLNIVPNKITVVSVPTAIRASLPGSPKESKNLPAMQKTQVQSLGQEDPLEKEMATTPVFLPEESHGQRSLVGYSPWGHKESDMTE